MQVARRLRQRELHLLTSSYASLLSKKLKIACSLDLDNNQLRKTMGRSIVLAISFATYCCLPLSLAAHQNPERYTRPSPTIFKEVAQQVGLKFQHYNGMTGKFYLPEITGSGSALFDFDNDGDLDVFIVQGNVLEPNIDAAKSLFPWTGLEPPRGRLFRNDFIIGR